MTNACCFMRQHNLKPEWLSCISGLQSCLPMIHPFSILSIFSPTAKPVCAKLQTSLFKDNPVNAENSV